MSNRLESQIRFLTEIDRLKGVERRTLIMDRSRQENTAEHSWHLGMAVMVLAEYGPRGMNLGHALKLAAIHDLPEIEAGDTFVYDTVAHIGKAEREQEAMNVLGGYLPQDLAVEVRALWDEFEEKKTPEARYVSALDRMMPLLNNYNTGGHSWRLHNISAARVLERNREIEALSPELWSFVQGLVKDAVTKGYLAGE